MCCALTLTSPPRDDTVQWFAEAWKFGENPARSRHCVSWTNCTAMLESDPASDELRQRGSQEPGGGTDVRGHRDRACRDCDSALFSRTGAALADLRGDARAGRHVLHLR